MSCIMYIASDAPLKERKNPHEFTLSVNEALALGIEDIPEFMLKEGFDRDKKDVLLYADREINIDVDSGVIEDGNFADDFAVWLREKDSQMPTEKKYCAEVEWLRFTTERGAMLIEYLKEQLEDADSIELWYGWLGEEVKGVELKRIALAELKPEDIEKLEKMEVWQEPLKHYGYLLVK